MALFTRLRPLLRHRSFSTILSPDSKTPLSAKDKTRAALSLLKSESNPEKILEICRAAYLTPTTHLDRIAFSVAVSKLSESNNFSYIQQFLDDLRRSRPDLQNERFAAHAIVLFGQANMLKDAIRTFQEYHGNVLSLGAESGSVRTLNALLFACFLAKDYSEVKRIFVEFPRSYKIEPNLDTYNTVIKAFCESGSSSSVYSVLAEMDRRDVEPNKTSFGCLLAGFYKEEKFEDVGKVLDLMKKKYRINPGVSTYNIRIQSLCKLKRTNEARALFDGMLARKMKPNSETYGHLIHGFCSEENLEEALRLFKRMASGGYTVDSQCYFTLAHYLCKSGDFDTALVICKESIGKGWVPNFSTMKSLVNGLVGVGKMEDAKEIVRQMKEKFKKNFHLWDEIEAGLPQ
uniref:Pentatricopeptide repeat-containing protein n=1 Tax=Rhizophora mucronata TaxID=61149 RepID=A0A2P2MZN4_RHIMU